MKQKKICCLPVAGIGNPYQHLMIQGLNEHPNLEAFNGHPSRFFGIILSAIRFRPEYLHFDWIKSYYWRRKKWMTIINIPWFYFQVFFVTKILKIKITWTSHNIHPHDTEDIKLHENIQRYFAKKSSWIRLFSELSVENASKAYGVPVSKFQIIPEGSYVGYYPNKISRHESRQQLGINEKQHVFLYLGFIKPYKGVENLIDVFKKLNKIDTKLIIAGNPIDKKYAYTIENLCKVQSNIFLKMHFIKEDDLQVLYNASDAVVLPFNKIENSGSAILAMGFKKIVIAPKNGVLPDRLVAQPEFLFDSLDDLLNIMSKIGEMELTSIEKIGLKNYENLKKFNWSNFTKAFI